MHHIFQWLHHHFCGRLGVRCAPCCTMQPPPDTHNVIRDTFTKSRVSNRVNVDPDASCTSECVGAGRLQNRWSSHNKRQSGFAPAFRLPVSDTSFSQLVSIFALRQHTGTCLWVQRRPPALKGRRFSCVVAGKWINGHCATGKKYRNKIGHIQEHYTRSGRGRWHFLSRRSTIM